MSPSIRGSATSAWPTSSPPTTTCSASDGMPPSSRQRTMASVVKTPCGVGLTTTVLPAASAAPAGPPESAIGKLNGAIDRPHAVRAHHVGRGLGRVQPAHGQLEPVVVDQLVAVVADQVGGLLDVAERLEPVLAHLDRQEGRDHVAPLGDQVGAGLEEADAVPPRRVGPGRGERLGDADGLGDVGGGSLHEPADQDVGVGGRALHDLGAGQALVTGDDRAVALAEERLELGQPGVEGCVHLVALGRHRRVGHSECHRLTSLVVGHQPGPAGRRGRAAPGSPARIRGRVVPASRPL